MPNSIIELIQTNMPTILKTVDLTLSTTSSTGAQIVDGVYDPILLKFFPIVSYQDAILALLKIRKFSPTIAYIIATDGEIPQDRERVTITQEILGNLKIGKARVFTEEDFEVMHRATMLTAIGSQASQALLNTFLAVPAQLTQSVKNLMMILTVRVACTGSCLYIDPTTGLTAELTYPVTTAQMPAALTGTARWSQVATANGIQNIMDHMEAIYGSLRRFPPYIIMGRKAANNLRQQTSTKLTVARMMGVITDSNAASPDALNSIEPAPIQSVSTAIANRLMGGGGLSAATEIIVSDSIYFQRGADGNTVTKSYIPDDYYFFAYENFIEEAIVPTASNDFAGGLVTTTEILSREPRREQVTVAGRGLPLCVDPRLLAARNVENTAIAG